MGLFSYEFPCSLVFPFLSSPLDSSYHIINSYNWQRFHTNFFRVFSVLRKTKAGFGLFYPTEKNARVQALSLLPLIRPRFAHPPSPEGEGSHSKVESPSQATRSAGCRGHPRAVPNAERRKRCSAQDDPSPNGMPNLVPSSGFAALAHLPPRGKAVAPRLSRPSKGRQSLRD